MTMKLLRRKLLIVSGTLAVASTAVAQEYSEMTLHSFAPFTNGAHPAAAVLQASDGNLYGTASTGGAFGFGCVFRISNLAGGPTYSIIYSFSGGLDGATPDASLIQASDGNLYGTASSGGGGGAGTVFRIGNLASAPAFTLMHSFAGVPDGAHPYASLIQASDGNLYGTTGAGGPYDGGTIFRITNLSGTPIEEVIGSFPGGQDSFGGPVAALTQASDGNLYGTTIGMLGTVFRVSNLSGSPRLDIIHFFGISPDGIFPYAPLIQALDGNLYGTTASGGASNAGTVYRISNLEGTPTESIIYSFSPGGDDGAFPEAGLIQASDGNLYGTTFSGFSSYLGTVFRISNLAGTPAEAVIHRFITPVQGSHPVAAVIQATDGNLYGTTGSGGAWGLGVVYAIENLDGSPAESVIHDFPNGADGRSPSGALVQAADHSLYGTTSAGGAEGNGTIFKISGVGAAPIQTIVYSFTGSDGSVPVGRLIQASDGNLYGTTSFGGAKNAGTVFKISNLAGTPTESVIYSFTGGWDGGNPTASLIQASDGTLYGMTSRGGAADAGTVYAIGDLAGTPTFSVIHVFNGGVDGGNPVSSLIQGSDGNLYGTLPSGGAYRDGLVFVIRNPGGNPTYSPIYNFAGIPDGALPLGDLIQAADGNLYGTTFEGGAARNGGVFANAGTVFRISNLSGSPTETVIYSFAGWRDAGGPRGGVIQAANGNLYGTSQAGGVGNAGSVFMIYNLSGVPNESVLYSFMSGSDGGGPVAGLTEAVDGNLYGTAFSGGTDDSGTVFGLIKPCFNDVPALSPFRSFICTIARDGVTAGCGAGNFCPSDSVLRSQMAVFLLRGEHGATYVPPACAGIFSDVACPGTFTDWAEELYAEGVTGGCGTNPLTFCPDDAVTRASMAVLLLRAQNGSAYSPPACTGVFADVGCPGAFTDWVEALYTAGITGGCGTNPLTYCPNDPVTRAQMAVFLVATFNLQ